MTEAAPHRGGGPLRADAYHSHPRPIEAIDQRVRTDFVLDVRDVDLRRRQPLQGLGDIAGPDAPCGTVSEFHHMAPIVLFDLHRRSPYDRSEPWMYQERRDAGHPAQPLERLLGRRTDALTNLLANVRIVLRHFQDRFVFLHREALVGDGLCQGIDGLIRECAPCRRAPPRLSAVDNPA